MSETTPSGAPRGMTAERVKEMHDWAYHEGNPFAAKHMVRELLTERDTLRAEHAALSAERFGYWLCEPCSLANMAQEATECGRCKGPLMLVTVRDQRDQAWRDRDEAEAREAKAHEEIARLSRLLHDANMRADGMIPKAPTGSEER